MTTRTETTVPHAEYFPPPRAPRQPSRWATVVRNDVRELVRFWPVIQNMVVQELRVRYQRSVLGFLWTLLNPILMMATMTFVFAHLFQQSTAGYAVYLFAGMVPWGFLASSVNECAFCIINNEGLIRKIYLPKLVFPITRLLINLTTLLLSMGALFLLVGPLGAKFRLPLLLLPIAVALLAMFVLGMGLVVATMNTFFRDCGHLVSVVLQAWYFATPIIYMPEFLKEQRWRLRLNPAYPFFRLFQIIIYEGRWPGLMLFTAAAVFATVSLGIGYAAFKCHEDKMVFRL